MENPKQRYLYIRVSIGLTFGKMSHKHYIVVKVLFSKQYKLVKGPSSNFFKCKCDIIH